MMLRENCSAEPNPLTSEKQIGLLLSFRHCYIAVDSIVVVVIRADVESRWKVGKRRWRDRI